VIYVNTNIRKVGYRQYKGVKYTEAFKKRHKATYKDILHTLVHELVHYRFTKMRHGKRFELRIREILGGRVFPETRLYADRTHDISTLDNKSIPIERTKHEIQEMYIRQV
jgi:hypothetical protein